MSGTGRVTRRAMLGAAVAGAILPLAAASARSAVPTDSWSQAAQRLRRLHPAPISARRIAQAYAVLHPEEAEPGAAIRHVASALSLPPEQMMAQGDDALRRLIEARTRVDFEEGNTVDVSGWMLSSTELRLCLLWL